MPQRPEPGEYSSWHAGYVALVPESDIVAVLMDQCEILERLIAGISPEQELFCYEPGKWSVRQVFGHVADTERIFGYRALCIARGQKEGLPAFDQNLFVDTAGFNSRPVAELADELLLLRHANLSMLQPLDSSAWDQVGTASEKSISTRVIAWIMAGHVRHHLELFRTRYKLSW